MIYNELQCIILKFFICDGCAVVKNVLVQQAFTHIMCTVQVSRARIRFLHG